VASSLWPAFSTSPEYQDGLAHPLDRWSQRIGTEMAAGLGAQVLYPFVGPPFQPFIRWAMKAGNVNASALGMLIDREYGLWHAYRFALALPEPLEEQTSNEQAESPCLSCAAKPCLLACPVKAFSGVAYNVNVCVDYLAADDTASCNHGGCLARRACPVGETYHYQPDHARFHMQAFLTAEHDHFF
jgi:ferredoxin